MAIEKVKAFFAGFGMEDRVLEFEVSSATVELAAQALHCEPCRIAKTLSFHVGEQVVLIVAAGDAKIDNPKYKAQFGTKAKMLAFDEAEARIGHAVGGQRGCCRLSGRILEAIRDRFSRLRQQQQRH